MRTTWSFIVVLGFLSCSTPKPIYNQKGQMMVQTRDRTSAEDALSSALSDAQKVCEQNKKTVVLIDKKSQYYGDLSEADYIRWQRLSRISTTAGVMHQGPLGDAGIRMGGVTQAALYNCGYEGTVTFDCR